MSHPRRVAFDDVVAAACGSGNAVGGPTGQRQHFRGRACRRTQQRLHRQFMRAHATLEVGAADADTACLEQEAHRIAQAADIAPRIRLHAAHRHRLVVRARVGREVPVRLELRAIERREDRRSKAGIGLPGELRREVADRRVLDERVVGHHTAKLGDPAIHHGELVRIDHDIRLIFAGHQRDGARLARPQQQVIAVHVDSHAGIADEGFRAVGIRARHDKDVDPVEQGLEVACGQARGDDQSGFAAGGFVAVLLRDDQHGRLAALDHRLGRRGPGRREHQQRDRASLLRSSDDA